MKKVYFFQKRNPSNGELLDEIIDASDHDGNLLYKQPRHYLYLGWSDGRFINKYKSKISMPTDKDKGDTPKQLKGEDRENLLQAYQDELEFARNNEDKTPPLDMSKVGIDGGPIKDPYLRAALESRQRG